MSASLGAQIGDSFLELLEKAGNFHELRDTDWLCDLAFDVDILIHTNGLN